MPQGEQDIGDIYQLRRLRPRAELVLRLGLVIAPAEELFWRGLLQQALTERYGRTRGAALAAGLYGGAHICTGNPTLVGAATVAGGGWSGLAAATSPPKKTCAPRSSSSSPTSTQPWRSPSAGPWLQNL
jgi:hypothetical protein